MMQIGVHFGGNFYEFVPWDGAVEWEIAVWGFWRISAENKSFLVNSSPLILIYSHIFYVRERKRKKSREEEGYFPD